MTRRTTLRPIETPVASAPTTPQPPAAAPPRPTAPTNRYMAAAIAAGAVVILAVLAFMATRTTPVENRPVATEEPVVAAPTVAASAAPAAPVATCPSISSFLDVMGSYERQGRWGLAASTAQTALRTPGLCEADRSALGQKYVGLSREALFEQPPAPEDAPGQRRVATAYSDLKTLAGQYGVQPPAPLPIAQSAYDNRLFLLATAAYADAFANGDTTPDDRAVVRADYASQYNLGLVWAQRSDATQRQDGLARLSTACRINEAQHLGSPEACNQLQTLLGPRAWWPAPLTDPLITTGSAR